MDQLSKDDVMDLISSEAHPRISLYMPTEKSAGNAINKMKIRFKNLLSATKTKLKNNWDYKDADIEELLSPLTGLMNDRDFWLNQSDGLAIYLTPESFQYFRLPLDFYEQVSVCRYFDLKQAVPEIYENREFYLLTLSRNNTRLFYLTENDITEIELAKLPGSFAEILEQDDSGRTLQHHSSSRGGGSAVFHGHETVEGDKKEDILQYFRLVDEAVSDYLKNKDVPLLLMCVEEIYPIYVRANTHNNLLEEFVKGSPGKLEPSHIFKASREVIEPLTKSDRQEAVERFKELQGSEKTKSDLKKILPDASYGKIQTLLIEEGAEQFGIFIPEDEKVEFSNDENLEDNYELYNYTLIQTISQGGKAFLIPEEEMPAEAGKINAIYRY